MEKMVPVGISAHHIHLSKADFNALFPNQEDLTHFKDLSQPGQYAAVEKLDVVSLDPKGKTIAGVRILGPLRPESQVELMRSECTKCKINGPVRSSGDTKGSGAVKLVNPLNGNEVILEEGVIVADRHIHFSTEDAEKFGVEDFAAGFIRLEGGIILDFRIAWAMNLDTPGDTIIMGTKASLRIPSTECWNGSVGGPMTLYHNVCGEATKTEIPIIPMKEDLFTLKVRTFLDAIKEGTEAPVPSSQILYNQAIIDGIAKSAECGREVEIVIPEI